MIRIQWIDLNTADGGVVNRLPAQFEIAQGSTVPQALAALGFGSARISEMLEQRAVAVFGMYATENTVLFEGDRLEILDGLQFDPMESRRRRARSFCGHSPIRLKELAMKKIAATLIALSAALLLGGCNTVKGVGQDVQRAGGALERAANK